MKPDKKLINFRIPEPLADDLKEVSDGLDMSQSQIVRDAVREKVAELKQRLATSVPNTEEVTVT
jgi:Arc/MetJ-type ribon-helix-helix transcriptional regulator